MSRFVPLSALADDPQGDLRTLSCRSCKYPFIRSLSASRSDSFHPPYSATRRSWKKMFNLFPKKSNPFKELPYWLNWFESQLPKNLSVQYPPSKKKQALEMLERKILEGKKSFLNSWNGKNFRKNCLRKWWMLK